jgi:hypothetical protein
VEFGDNLGRIFLGDLAGYENRFNCRLSRMPGFNQAKYMGMYQENAYWRNEAKQDQSIWQIEEVRDHRTNKENFKMPTKAELDSKIVIATPTAKRNKPVASNGTPNGTPTEVAEGGGPQHHRGGADDPVVWGVQRKGPHHAFNKMQRNTGELNKNRTPDDHTKQNIANIVAEYNKVYSSKETDTSIIDAVLTKVKGYYKFDEKNNVYENKLKDSTLKWLAEFCNTPVDDLFDKKNEDLGKVLAGEMEVLPASLDGESDQILAPRDVDMQSDADRLFNTYLYEAPSNTVLVNTDAVNDKFKSKLDALKGAFSAQQKFGDIVHRPGQLYGAVEPNPATFT